MLNNGQQSNIFWFNWHNKLMLLRIICKKNILFNDKLKTIISLHFLYACHIYCKSHILHGDYSFIINALLWTFWLPRFMKVINHFQSVIDWLSSFQSGQARHKFNYIQIFYEYLTEIRYNTSVGGKKTLPNLPIWLFNFLESCNLKQCKKRLFYFKKDI